MIIDISDIARDAPLSDRTSETTSDYRYYSHHDQRNKADTHINGVQS